ncbi:MAG: hypothetical protein P4L76_18020 [Beijerinckiaceae bacterium]|nr:hypothetical protein [Beijerinckiaceae bacterium]
MPDEITNERLIADLADCELRYEALSASNAGLHELLDVNSRAIAELTASNAALSAALSEARGRVGEAEWERDEANLAFQASMQRTAYLEKTKLNFVEALEACKRGLEAWRDEPHNAKWWRRIDGTPIPNDLLVNIAEIIVQTANADRAERDAALSELAKLRGALTPSADTKAEYIGEFKFAITGDDEDGQNIEMVTVPWTTIKEIMARILAYALPSPPKDPAHD